MAYEYQDLMLETAEHLHRYGMITFVEPPITVEIAKEEAWNELRPKIMDLLIPLFEEGWEVVGNLDRGNIVLEISVNSRGRTVGAVVGYRVLLRREK